MTDKEWSKITQIEIRIFICGIGAGLFSLAMMRHGLQLLTTHGAERFLGELDGIFYACFALTILFVTGAKWLMVQKKNAIADSLNEKLHSGL